MSFLRSGSITTESISRRFSLFNSIRCKINEKAAARKGEN
jgi:hypothetical protein